MAEIVSAHLLLSDPGEYARVESRCEALHLTARLNPGTDSVAVRGDLEAVQQLVNSPVVPTQRKTVVGRASTMAAQYAVSAEAEIADRTLRRAVTGIVFPVRPHYYAVSAFPPRVPYYHLHVPQDIARLLCAQAGHAAGLTGKKIKVAMIDTGFYRQHPYYSTPLLHGGRKLDITTHGVLGLPQSDPNKDEYGHGTGIASNVLSVAPECEFHHIKDDGDPVAAFGIARSVGAQVITNSWGWPEDYVQQQFTQNGPDAPYLRLLETAVRDAVNAGIAVLFASGNGPLPGSWPSGMPEVVSVGGALIDVNGDLSASSYATSFISQVYPNRRCPDVCGLVGPAPNGLLIMMPTQPNNTLDGEFSAVDGTLQGDGWLVASGTSSATPQVAGIVALLLQIKSSVTPANVKAALQDMAVGVNQGASASGHAATVQRPNLATGYGLVTLRRPNRNGGYTLL